MKTKRRSFRGGKPKGSTKSKPKPTKKQKNAKKAKKPKKKKTPKAVQLHLQDILDSFLKKSPMRKTRMSSNLIMPKMKCSKCGHCSGLSKKRNMTPRLISHTTGTKIACQKINNGPMVCRKIDVNY